MLLLPIGHNLGVRHHDGADPVQQVRLGAEIVELPGPDFALWALAHGRPVDTPDDARWNRDAILACARGLGLTEADVAVDALLGRGLLAEVDPADSAAFASTHRLVPLLLGLGTTEEAPDLYRVGLLGQPLVAMAGGLADVWEWADQSATLWAACLESREVLAGVVGALHSLLAVNAVYLDTVLLGTVPDSGMERS